MSWKIRQSSRSDPEAILPGLSTAPITAGQRMCDILEPHKVQGPWTCSIAAVTMFDLFSWSDATARRPPPLYGPNSDWPSGPRTENRAGQRNTTSFTPCGVGDHGRGRWPG
jgi:hypothetical protein